MPAITLREVIGELAAGARIVADDQNCFELQYPGTPIPGHMLNHELVRGGWVESAPNGGSYRLTDAGRLAYMRSTDELGNGELVPPAAGAEAAEPRYYCNKCGSFPNAVHHKRPDGTDCPYIARVAPGVTAAPVSSVEERLKMQSGPFKGKPQGWFTRDEVLAILATYGVSRLDGETFGPKATDAPPAEKDEPC